MVELRSRGADGEPILPLEAVCDLNEILIVRYENQRRAQRRAEQQSRSKRRG